MLVVRMLLPACFFAVVFPTLLRHMTQYCCFKVTGGVGFIGTIFFHNKPRCRLYENSNLSDAFRVQLSGSNY
jgi:hypothetical protein